MIQTDTMYDWEKEARFAEIRTEEMFGYEARRKFHDVREGASPIVVQVRSLYSPDWSDDHEA
jgi:hypothetical protein